MPESAQVQTSTAPAQPVPGQTAAKPNYTGLIGMYAVIMVIFYLFLIKPQKDKLKKRQEMLSGLKKGDAVQTTGGLRGQVVDVKDDYVVMKVAKEVKVEVGKEAVHALQAPQTSS